MAKLKNIRVLSLAKLQAVVMAFVGLIVGIVYSFGGAIYEAYTGTLNSGTALAFFALIGMPILFAVFGYVTGIIGACLYNVTSKWFGGIDINIQQ
jgi:hypothetical protein